MKIDKPVGDVAIVLAHAFLRLTQCEKQILIMLLRLTHVLIGKIDKYDDHSDRSA